MAEPSIKDLAYRTAAGVFGGPVDLATMVMRPFGYKTPDEQVFGSSEYIGKKLEDVGLVSSARAPITEFLTSMAVPTPGGIAKGAALAAPMIGGMFVGKGAKTWDALQASKAKMLADMGTDARTIWKETGTWKGPDGKWRQEIDGSAPFTPSINPQAGAMLRDQPANLGVSKVINNFKVPKTLYHGSAEPFESFDPKLLGTNTKSSDAEIGFHFSDNKADASLYADMAKRQQLRRDEPWLSESDVQFESGVVRPFNLDIKNPLVIGGDESEGNAGKFTQQFLDDKWAARKYADENGYDGIIYPQGTNVDSGYTVIAFEPSQIKKQVVNQPTNE